MVHDISCILLMVLVNEIIEKQNLNNLNLYVLTYSLEVN